MNDIWRLIMVIYEIGLSYWFFSNKYWLFFEMMLIDDIESFSECQNERFSEYKIYYDILRRLKGETVNHSSIQVKNIWIMNILLKKE